MPFKNYYVILGVPREESQGGIRARYLDLVKSLHPDVAGQESTAALQDVTEAYEVLSDPLHRRRYNRELNERERSASGKAAPGGRVDARSREPLAVRDFQTVRPSYDALFERLLRNFGAGHVPKSEHLEPLEFEVLMTPEEAAEGGSIPIEIPVFRTCRLCRGTGREWLYACSRCAGRGLAAEEEVIEIRFPPLGVTAAVFDVPLRGLGIANLYLRLHLRVSSVQAM